MMQAGQFRADLYYRLQAHEINLPPLRERPEDIRLLASAFINEAAEMVKKSPAFSSAEIFSALASYSWPGNIRELRGLLFDAVTRNTTDRLDVSSLIEKLRERQNGTERTDAPKLMASVTVSEHEPDVRFPSTLPTADKLELMLIHEALRRTNGNKTQAADLIALTRNTINNRLKEIPPAD
jgi:DNA-binding NtrC family response regulator